MPIQQEYPQPAFNRWLGLALVTANSLLFYAYFLLAPGVSENDTLYLWPLLGTFVAGQLLLLARGSAPTARRPLYVLFGLALAVAVLLWAGYALVWLYAAGYDN